MTENLQSCMSRFTGQRFSSLRLKMTLLFGSISIGLLLLVCWVWAFGIPFTGYAGSYKQQRSEVLGNLELVADLRKDRFELWLKERSDDAQGLATSGLVSTAVNYLDKKVQRDLEHPNTQERVWTDLTQDSEYIDLRDRFRSFSGIYKVYSKVVAIGARTGRVLMSTDNDDLGQVFSGKPYCTAILQSVYRATIEFEQDQKDAKLYLVISQRVTSDVKEPELETVGVVALYIDMNDVVNPLLYAGVASSETDDIVLVNSNCEILLPLRFPLQNGTRPKPLEYKIEAIPALLASQSREGTIETLDYRGVPVLAVYRHSRISPEQGLGLVVKRDSSEVFGPVWSNLLVAMCTGLVVIVVSIPLLAFAARKISKPIEDLSVAAQRVQSGDFEARVTPHGAREVMLLATAFNVMVARLGDWHKELAAQIMERTSELEQKNQQLTSEIEERKLAEATLRASEERYRVTLLSVGDGVIATDSKGRVKVLNPVAEALTGWRHDEAYGRPLEEVFRIVNEETGQPIQNPVRRVMTEGVVVGLANHTLLISQNGTERPIADSGAPIRDSYGAIIGVVLVFRDQTLERAAQKALQDQFEELERSQRHASFLSNLIEESSQPLAVGYPDGRLGILNNAFCRLVGYSKEELANLDWAGVLTPPEWLEGERAKIEELHRTGLPVRYEKEYIRKDGTRVPIELFVHLVKDETGDPDYYYSFLNDITERKGAEDALRRAHVFTTALLENIIDGVVACDADGKLVLFNRTAREWHGLDPMAIPQEKWADYYDLYCADGVTPMTVATVPLARAFRGEVLRNEGMVIRAKGQPERHIVSNCAPFFDEKGTKLGAVAGMHDITEHKRFEEERKKTEEEIRRLNTGLEQRVILRTDELEAANKELEAFSYSVSHDLRAPLRSISGFSQILATDYLKNLDERGRHYLDNILEATAHMDRLISDLLNYSRVGRRSVRHQAVQLGDLLARISRTMEDQFTQANASLTIQDDMPMVIGDETLLDQIFTNLIVNALTYRRTDVSLTVDVSFQVEGQVAVVRVTDNGIGIRPEYLEKIFNMFQRLHSQDAYPGTGIGLALVKKSVALLGGEVLVESIPGKGSAFIVKLPAVT